MADFPQRLLLISLARRSPIYCKTHKCYSLPKLLLRSLRKFTKAFTMPPQNKEIAMPAEAINRKQMIKLLNEDLSREYQAVIAYVVYSQVLKGPEYMNIAKELESHAKEELDHALKIAKQIDYLGGMPIAVPKPVKTSEKAQDMLRFDLDNERETIANYRRRILQADAMNEFALSEMLREVVMQEQDHLIDLATALGIDPPDPGIAP